MLVIPAVDLKDGKVVRLYRGQFDEATIYSEDPVAVAKNWESLGARLIHVVDLDGALMGQLKNLSVVEEIAKNINIPIEAGGGIRTEGAVKELLEKGVHRVILGTKACQDEPFVRKMIADFGERVMVSIDVKEGKVATDGWTKVTQINATVFIKKLEDFGLRVVIYTDIGRDGTMAGPNTEALREILASRGSILVIASGGISSLDDLKELKSLESDGLFGAIVGRALYEGRIDLARAIEEC